MMMISKLSFPSFVSLLITNDDDGDADGEGEDEDEDDNEDHIVDGQTICDYIQLYFLRLI